MGREREREFEDQRNGVKMVKKESESYHLESLHLYYLHKHSIRIL